MLPKVNRFSFKRRVPRKLYSSPFFSVRYERNELGGLECSVVVGKKVDKSAVVRNKIRRTLILLIEEVFSRNFPYTIVLYAKKPANGASKEILNEECGKLLNTIK